MNLKSENFLTFETGGSRIKDTIKLKFHPFGGGSMIDLRS